MTGGVTAGGAVGEKRVMHVEFAKSYKLFIFFFYITATLLAFHITFQWFCRTKSRRKSVKV